MVFFVLFSFSHSRLHPLTSFTPPSAIILINRTIAAISIIMEGARHRGDGWPTDSQKLNLLKPWLASLGRQESIVLAHLWIGSFQELFQIILIYWHSGLHLKWRVLRTAASYFLPLLYEDSSAFCSRDFLRRMSKSQMMFREFSELNVVLCIQGAGLCRMWQAGEASSGRVGSGTHLWTDLDREAVSWDL